MLKTSCRADQNTYSTETVFITPSVGMGYCTRSCIGGWDYEQENQSEDGTRNKNTTMAIHKVAVIVVVFFVHILIFVFILKEHSYISDQQPQSQSFTFVNSIATRRRFVSCLGGSGDGRFRILSM